MIDFDAKIQTSRGHYQSFAFDLVDEISNQPLDLANFTLDATFRERGKTPLLLTLSSPKISSQDTSAGTVSVILDEVDSRLLPSRDRTHCHNDEFNCPAHTCVMQINGTAYGRKYLLATIGIDNISSTSDGET